jgi:hypothetical protein
LFDTPGIGDTRGVEYDVENMADMLSVLSNYEKLHGIVILLKANSARVTIMFRFCINELLTQLHRDAVQNMVFGFTNTRGSSYQPGDTLDPLSIELASHENVDIGLYESTVYCFDSESFRYLAAYQQGVDLGDRADYSRSWEKSAQESQRLVRYIQSLTPHRVKSTISLNDTRHMITELTKPMADIMRTMDATIKMNQEQIESLSEDKLKKEDLEKNLLVTVKTLQAHQLDRPRTVCRDENCVDYYDDRAGSDKESVRVLSVVYKSLCHDPCYLDNIPADQLSPPGLLRCYAFDGGDGFCNGCSHSWQQHLHVLYELKPAQKTIKSKEVESKLKDAKSDMEKKEIAIAEKELVIKEIKAEYDEIAHAAIQFCIFLKKNSITPYNDATLEYLEIMIKEERGKVAVGGARTKLEALEKYRAQYQEKVNILTKKMESGDDSVLLSDKEVHEKVQHLYKLKHYGENLRAIKTIVSRAHRNTFRETPHNIPVKAKGWVFSGARAAVASGARAAVASGLRQVRDGFTSGASGSR